MAVGPRAGLPEPYTPGLTVQEAVERFGAEPDQVVKLGSGENPLGPSPAAVRAIGEAAGQLNRYPEWTSARLRGAVAERFGVAPEQVICGAGETEIISAVIRAFAEPGGEILMHRPTFPIYHLYAEADGRRPVYADAGWAPTIDVDGLVAEVTERTRVVFLTTPHNPSGRLVPTADIRRVCAAAPAALVVVDEAYIHFSDQESAVRLLAEYANLIVLRTFSKAYGLAGLRVGFGIGGSDIVAALLRVKPTWNLGHPQVAGAVAALDDIGHLRRTTEQTIATRRWVATAIDELPGFSVVPGSAANFLLVRLDAGTLGSTELFGRLATRGLIVKDGSVSYLGLGDRYLRVDIGPERAMTRLVDALGEAV